MIEEADKAAGDSEVATAEEETTAVTKTVAAAKAEEQAAASSIAGQILKSAVPPEQITAEHLQQHGRLIASSEKSDCKVYLFQSEVFAMFLKSRETVPSKTILHSIVGGSLKAQHVGVEGAIPYDISQKSLGLPLELQSGSRQHGLSRHLLSQTISQGLLNAPALESTESSSKDASAMVPRLAYRPKTTACRLIYSSPQKKESLQP